MPNYFFGDETPINFSNPWGEGTAPETGFYPYQPVPIDWGKLISGGNKPTEPGIGPGGTVIPAPTKTAPENIFDYWTEWAKLMGDEYDTDQLTALRNLISGQKGWRVPRKAQDMFAFANALSGFGDEGKALGQQMALMSLMQGWQRPKLDLASLLGPAFSQWGMGFAQPQAAPRSSRAASSGGDDMSGLLSMLMGMQ